MNDNVDRLRDILSIELDGLRSMVSKLYFYQILSKHRLNQEIRFKHCQFDLLNRLLEF